MLSCDRAKPLCRRPGPWAWLNKGLVPEKSVGAFADLGHGDSIAPRDAAAMTPTDASAIRKTIY